MTYNPDVVTELIHERTRARGGQERLAAAVGVTKQTVSRWASGGGVPDPHRWAAIEEALGYPTGTFAAEAGMAGAGSALERLEALEEQIRAMRQLLAQVTEELAGQAEALAKLAEKRSRRHG